MIAKILFLFTALFVQEFVVLNTLLLAAYQGLYSEVLIFALFVIATGIDIVIGFYIGRYLSRKTSTTRVGKYIKNVSERFSFPKNSPRRWLTLLILGNVSFCYVNAAVAGYLDLPFWESQAYNFFGNIVAVLAVWFVIGSVTSLFKNFYAEAGIIVGISLLILFVMRRIRVKKI